MHMKRQYFVFTTILKLGCDITDNDETVMQATDKDMEDLEYITMRYNSS